MNIPIFPLNSIIFPDGCLPLKIFEPRYLDMVSECLKTETGFGICLIKEGEETGGAAIVHRVGTLCDISYFNAQSDGLLGITATGKQRFRMTSSEVRSNQLRIAEVELIDNEASSEILEEHTAAVDLLRTLLAQLGQPYTKMPKHYDCSSWVSSRLTELLPFSLRKKQSLLEMSDPNSRLLKILDIMQLISKNKSS